ncbi:MAG: hypothetical protein QXQ46_04980 [Thermoplasmatales archaeon]
MRIKKFYGGGALDRGRLFDKLHSIGTQPVIKIRKSLSYYDGSKYRRRIVRK